MQHPEVSTEINKKNLSDTFNNKCCFFQPEDTVYVRNYSGAEKWISARVLSSIGNFNYKELTVDEVIQIRNDVGHITKCYLVDSNKILVEISDCINLPLLPNLANEYLYNLKKN